MNCCEKSDRRLLSLWTAAARSAGRRGKLSPLRRKAPAAGNRGDANTGAAHALGFHKIGEEQGSRVPLDIMEKYIGYDR